MHRSTDHTIPDQLRALADMAGGCPCVVVGIDAIAGLPRRMAMLGIRRGTPLHLLQGPDARGAVVAVGTARIALGRDIIASIRVRPTHTVATP